YLRFGFTLFTMGLSVYIIVQFVWTVHHDLEMKAVEYSSEIARQVSECSKSYFENRCDPVAGRLPAMQALCSEWELCMSRD
ncbi:Brl1/Brr6 domain-containing protein, partial [Zopfochytrium polystomum]